MSDDLRWTWRLAIRDDHSLSSRANLVAATLALHMERDGSSCHPSIEKLERETGYSRNTVLAAIDDLERAGYLVVTRGGGRRPDGTGRPNAYQPIVPNGAPAEPFSASNGSVEAPRTVQQLTGNGSAAEPEKDREKDRENDNPPVADGDEGEQVLVGEVLDNSGWRDAFNALADETDSDPSIDAERLAKATKLILAACRTQGIAETDAPAEIRRRARLYRDRWDADLTPLALAHNWTRVTLPRGRGRGLSMADVGEVVDQVLRRTSDPDAGVTP